MVMNDQSFSPSDLNIPQADWEQTPVSVRAVVIALYYRVQQVDTLEKRIAELEEQVKLNSSNSSKPPSSDGPRHKPEPPLKPKKQQKTRWATRSQRTLPQVLPSEDISEFVIHRPDSCRYCGDPLVGEDPNPVRWQVTELPPVKPIVTEHQIHRLCCSTVAKPRGQNFQSKLLKVSSGIGLRRLSTC